MSSSNADKAVDKAAEKVAEKAAAEKEAAEQAALPYKWKQTISEVDITVPVPQGARGRDVLEVFKYTERVVNMVRPRKLLMIAVGMCFAENRLRDLEQGDFFSKFPSTAFLRQKKYRCHRR